MCNAMAKRTDLVHGNFPDPPSVKTERFVRNSIIIPYMKAVAAGNPPPTAMTTYMNHFKVRFHVTRDIYHRIKQALQASAKQPLLEQLGQVQQERDEAPPAASNAAQAIKELTEKHEALHAETEALRAKLHEAVQDRAREQARVLEARAEADAAAEALREHKNADRRPPPPDLNTRVAAVREAIFIRLHRKAAFYKYYHMKAGRLDPRLFAELLSTEATRTLSSVADLAWASTGEIVPQRVGGVDIFLCGNKGSSDFQNRWTKDGAGIHSPSDTFPSIQPTPTGDTFVFAHLSDAWLVRTTELATGADGRPGIVESRFSTATFPWALQGNAVALPLIVPLPRWAPGSNVTKGVSEDVARAIVASVSMLRSDIERSSLSTAEVNTILGVPSDLRMPAASAARRPQLPHNGTLSFPAIQEWTVQRRVAAAGASLLTPAAWELMNRLGAPCTRTAIGTWQVHISALQNLREAGMLQADAMADDEAREWHQYYRVPPVDCGECVSLLHDVAHAIDRTRLLQADLGVRRDTSALHVSLLRVETDQPLHVEVSDQPHAFQSLSTPIPTSREGRPRFPVGLHRPTSVRDLPLDRGRGHVLDTTSVDLLRTMDFDFQRLPIVSRAITPIGTSTVLPHTVVHGGPAPLYGGMVRAVLQWATVPETAQLFAYNVAEECNADGQIIAARRSTDPLWRARIGQGLPPGEEDTIAHDALCLREQREAARVHGGLLLRGAVSAANKNVDLELTASGGLYIFDTEPALLDALRAACGRSLPGPGTKKWTKDTVGDTTTYYTLFKGVKFTPHGRKNATRQQYSPMPALFAAFSKAFVDLNEARLAFLIDSPEPWRTAYAEGRLFGGFVSAQYGYGRPPADFHMDNLSDGLLIIVINVGTQPKLTAFQDRASSHEDEWTTHEVPYLPGQGYMANVGVIAHRVTPQQEQAHRGSSWQNSDMTLIFRTALKKKEHEQACSLVETNAEAQASGDPANGPREESPFAKFLRTIAERTTDGWEIPTLVEVNARRQNARLSHK